MTDETRANTDWQKIWQWAHDEALAHTSEAEDVAQEVCIAMMSRKPKPIVHLEQFVRVAAKRLAVRVAAKSQRLKLVDALDIAESIPSPAHQAEIVHARHIAKRAIDLMARHKVGVSILYGHEADATARKRLSRCRSDIREIKTEE